MTAAADVNWIRVELGINPRLLASESHLSRQEQLAEEDAVVIMLGRQALAKFRTKLADELEQ